MTTARQIMHEGVETIPADFSLSQTALRMRDLGIGALPVCDADGTPIGIVTDRDIIVKCLAEQQDPVRMTAGAVASGPLVTVTADTDITEVLTTMEEHRIRRLPVIENREMIGIITEADLSRRLPERQTGEFVEAVCTQ